MTTRNRSRRTYPSRRARRRVAWDTSILTQASLGPGVLGTSILNQNWQERQPGVTILRMVGNLQVVSAAAAAPTAFTAGISFSTVNDSPSPSGDIDEPWLWITHGFTDGDQRTRHIEFDVKSRRRMREADNELRFQMANNDGLDTLNYGFVVRTLIALT